MNKIAILHEPIAIGTCNSLSRVRPGKDEPRSSESTGTIQITYGIN